MTFIKDPATRKWIYGVIAAAIPLLVMGGLLTAEASGLWLVFAAAVLGLGASGLAFPNTNPKSTDEDEEDNEYIPRHSSER